MNIIVNKDLEQATYEKDQINFEQEDILNTLRNIDLTIKIESDNEEKKSILNDLNTSLEISSDVINSNFIIETNEETRE